MCIRDSLEGAPEEHSYHSARTGPRPKLVAVGTLGEELDAAADILRNWLPDPSLSHADNVAAGRAAAAEDIACLLYTSRCV